MRINVNVNVDSIDNKLNSLIKDDATMLEIHNLFAKTIDPWVPFLEGPLSQTVEIEPHLIRYIQPYARYQYYGVGFNHTKDYHPLASAMWDQAAMQVKRDDFVKQVMNIIKRRARKVWWTKMKRSFNIF